MKFLADRLFSLATHITWVARYFASAEDYALALEAEEAGQEPDAVQQARLEYEARAMGARIAISESTRSDISRQQDGPLFDVWIEDFNPSSCREATQP